MRINSVVYKFDDVEQLNVPTLFPGEDIKNWSLPDNIQTNFYKLNSILEGKYSREFLKICAFYNKMFPSLKYSDWSTSTYLVQPFTYQDQERTDTGTGISMNYLKQIIDQITSRLGAIQFVPYLMSEDQSYEYIIYKDEVERILRMYINKDKFNRTCIAAFHDAAVLGYSYVFLDPFTGALRKANDYEVGIFESQLNKKHILQMLYRDYAFPTVDTITYINELCSGAQRDEILESIQGTTNVDLCMYFNCLTHSCHVSINGKVLPPKEYPFDTVLVACMIWDIGFSSVTTSSLFDLLYPIQREINKINAKQQQLIRNYKGATPVFNSDVELAMKSISNGAGECLYVDSQRPIDSLMTVINPTPLDSELAATITGYKTTMYELAGIQNASFDMENMRSAAAVIALDQTRDSVFQSQLSGLSDFISEALQLYIRYNAAYKDSQVSSRNVDWDAIAELLDTSYINLKPVHLNNPLSDEASNSSDNDPGIDYMSLCLTRAILKVVKGQMSFFDIPYYIDTDSLVCMVAATLIKFEALGIDVPVCMHVFLMDAFIDAIKHGEVTVLSEQPAQQPVQQPAQQPAQEEAE